MGINQGTSGNVSKRVPGGFLITPSGVPYETMKPEQVVFMDLGGGYYGGNLPSSEWRLHYDVYLARPDAQAVVHAHPCFCTALSAQRKGIPAFHYMVGVAGGKEIRCAEYATFGTQELSAFMIDAMAGGLRACLLANHGMVCYGPSLEKALWLTNEVEQLARQYIYTLSLGPPVLLSDEEMDIVLAKFMTYGKQADEVAKLGPEVCKHAIVMPPKRGPDHPTEAEAELLLTAAPVAAGGK